MKPVGNTVSHSPLRTWVVRSRYLITLGGDVCLSSKKQSGLLVVSTRIRGFTSKRLEVSSAGVTVIDCWVTGLKELRHSGESVQYCCPVYSRIILVYFFRRFLKFCILSCPPPDVSSTVILLSWLERISKITNNCTVYKLHSSCRIHYKKCYKVIPWLKAPLDIFITVLNFAQVKNNCQ